MNAANTCRGGRLTQIIVGAYWLKGIWYFDFRESRTTKNSTLLDWSNIFEIRFFLVGSTSLKVLRFKYLKIWISVPHLSPMAPVTIPKLSSNAWVMHASSIWRPATGFLYRPQLRYVSDCQHWLCKFVKWGCFKGPCPLNAGCWAVETSKLVADLAASVDDLAEPFKDAVGGRNKGARRQGKDYWMPVYVLDT